MKELAKNGVKTIGALVSGATAAAFFWFLSFIMVGGGHGWSSAYAAGLCSLIIFPWIALTVILPLGHVGRLLSLILLAIADAIVIVHTWDEGVEYVKHAAGHIPGTLALWAMIWGGAHVIALALFIVGIRKQVRSRPSTGID